MLTEIDTDPKVSKHLLTMKETKGQPGRHLSGDERRATTVEAVLQLAAEQNPGEITTAAISQRLRLTSGALFRHFPTKEAIWEAVMAWVSDRLLARVAEAAERVGSPVARLEAVFLAHADFVARHPGVPRMLFSELQRPADSPVKGLVRALMAKYSERLRRLLAEGKACGEVAEEIDEAAAATMFIGTMQGLVMQAMLGGAATGVRKAAPAAFALYRRAIGRTR